jgi:hypothetical protein
MGGTFRRVILLARTRQPGHRDLSPAGAETGRAAAGREQGSGHAGALVQCLRRNRTTSTMITMITMTPKLINMGYSSRYLRVSQR